VLRASPPNATGRRANPKDVADAEQNRERANDPMQAKLVRNETNPESTEILAEAVVRIGEAFYELKRKGLNERAIVVLVADASGVNKSTVTRVLSCLDQLRGYYCGS
jgi:hypothetical protein